LNFKKRNPFPAAECCPHWPGWQTQPHSA